MADHVALTVKHPGERGPLELVILAGRVSIRGDDGLIEDLAAGEIGVQVDVAGQDEVLVVIAGSLAQQDQIGGRGDLVGVLSRAAAPAVFGRRGGNDGQKKNGGRYTHAAFDCHTAFAMTCCDAHFLTSDSQTG